MKNSKRAFRRFQLEKRKRFIPKAFNKYNHGYSLRKIYTKLPNYILISSLNFREGTGAKVYLESNGHRFRSCNCYFCRKNNRRISPKKLLERLIDEENYYLTESYLDSF